MNNLENESLYRALVDNSPDAIVLTDLNATILRANPAAGELFGVDARALIGKPGFALLAPEEHADGVADMRAFLETGAQQNFEYTFLRGDGTRARAEVRAAIWRDTTGAPQGFVLIARDITERARTEAELRASESRYRLLAENISDVIFALDLGLRFTYISASVQRLAGYTPAQVVGKTLDEFLTPASMAFVHQLLRQDSDAGDFTAPLPRQVEMRHANGSIVWVETRITFILDAAHKPQGMYGVTRDISARKQAEDALRQERDQSKQYLDIADVMIVALDRAGVITLINQKGCAILGYAPNEIIGRDWFATCLPAAVREQVRGVFAQLMTGDIAPVRFYENPVITKNGVERLLAFHNTITREADQRITGILFSGEDITEHRRAREELLWRNQELTALNRIVSALAEARPLDQMLGTALERALHAFALDVGAIYLLDATTGTLAPVAARGIDPAREEIIAAQIRAGVNPASAQFMNNARAPFSAVIPLKARDESVGVMFLFGAHLLDERAVQFLLTIGQQIGVTIENARLAEQTREIDVLREMDRLRAELVANVSHELRTPLGLIKLFITALLKQPEKFDLETQREFLTNIDEETDRLTHIVDNLLDLSRIQAGRLRLDKHPTDLGELARALIANLMPGLTRHQLRAEFTDALIAPVDAKRMEQVLSNLLRNAIKYSPNGGAIILSGRVGVNEIILHVRDHGIGIPATDLERVFERFYRVENTVTQTIDGVGLGLAVCRGIIQAHGGKIWVESTVGKGSTFFFTLPLEQVSERN